MSIVYRYTEIGIGIGIYHIVQQQMVVWNGISVG